MQTDTRPYVTIGRRGAWWQAQIVTPVEGEDPQREVLAETRGRVAITGYAKEEAARMGLPFKPNPSLPKRGEQMARWMIDRLDQAGVQYKIVRTDEGERAVQFLNRSNETQEQKDIGFELVCFMCGYPRHFATMDRLLKEANHARND